MIENTQQLHAAELAAEKTQSSLQDGTQNNAEKRSFASDTNASGISEGGFDWSEEEFANFGKEIQLLSHNYHQSPLFSDTALIKLLDDYPRTWLQCYTMGTNPEKHHEWTPVHVADLSGSEIMRALEKGRMWINAVNIDKYSDEYGQMIATMYEKIAANCGHIHNLRNAFNALLISSPGVQVYYHVDADPNMLWHIRGEKKVWVYPARDSRFTPHDYIEEIIAHERHENLPYERWFDEHAYSVVLKGGQAVSWPQHSPHRVENLGLNVSLTSSYESRESRRLVGVHAANYYFLKKLGIKNRPTQTQGLIPVAKAFSYYALNKLQLLKKGSRTSTYISDIAADPTSENGMSRMANASRTAFSYIDE